MAESGGFEPRDELKAMVRDFQPNLLIVDPFNACVRDAMEKDFQAAFARLREITAESSEDTACLILHHLRKPKPEDRHRGRNLANLLSGSYVLVSVSRSVMVMQPASDDVEDARVVFITAKNNDGQLGARTAWERKDGALFVPVPNFNFEEFDSGTAKPRETNVREEHLIQLFDNGKNRFPLAHAVECLRDIADEGRSVGYEALKLEGGRFSDILEKRDGLIGMRSAVEMDCEL